MLKVSPAIAFNQLLNTGNQELKQCKVPSDRRKPLLAKIPKKGDHSRYLVRATASIRSQVTPDKKMYSKHTSWESTRAVWQLLSCVALRCRVRLGRVSFSERKLSKASLNAVICKKLLLIWITNLHTRFDLIIELKKELWQFLHVIMSSLAPFSMFALHNKQHGFRATSTPIIFPSMMFSWKSDWENSAISISSTRETLVSTHVFTYFMSSNILTQFQVLKMIRFPTLHFINSVLPKF